MHIDLQQNRVLECIKQHFVYNFSGQNVVYFCTLLSSVSPKLYRIVIESRLIESIVGLAARQWDRTNYDLKQILRLIAEQIQQTAKTN